MWKNAVATISAVLWISANSAQGQALVPNMWSQGAAMPTARMGALTGVMGTKVYVVGGETNTAALTVNEVYDAATNTWSTAAPMPTARWLAGCCGF